MPLTDATPPSLNDEEVDRVRRAYNEIATKYDGAYLRKKDIAENMLVVSELLRGRFTIGDVLDAGCGTGFLLDQLRIDPKRYIGIDVSEGMLERARVKHPEHLFKQDDMQDPHLPIGAFDSVVSLFGCFNYCRRSMSTVTALRRLLRHRGRLMLLVCTPRHEKRASYVLQGSAPDRLFYTAAELRALLEYAGFQGVRVAGMMALTDHLPVWLPQWVFDLWALVERATVGRFAPDLCYYLIATATKG